MNAEQKQIGISQEYLKSRLTYCQDTGVFTWLPISEAATSRALSTWNARYSGKMAGTFDSKGYLRVQLLGKLRALHRLAFLYVTGELPHEVDHINGAPHDNRWINLRAATRSSNCRNIRLSATNKSGVVGVCWATKEGKWIVQIIGNNGDRKKWAFDNLFDAVAARKSAELKFGYHENHGRKTALAAIRAEMEKMK